MLTVATGPRLGRFSQDGDPREISGHSLPLVAFGGMILCMGWFGFNGGSTLKAAAVGAVAVHGAAGIWGTIAAGLFKSGDLFNLALVKVQLIGIGAAFVWAFPMGFVTFKVINAVVGLRVGSQDEQRGLDFTEHYELGYPEFQDAVLHAGKA